MAEDDLRIMVREFRSSMTAELDANSRRVDALADEIRNRFSTMESAFLNELRAMTRRLEARLVAIEGRLAAIEGDD